MDDELDFKQFETVKNENDYLQKIERLLFIDALTRYNEEFAYSKFRPDSEDENKNEQKFREYYTLCLQIVCCCIAYVRFSSKI